MFFTFPEDARWNVETQAVEFGVEIREYRGVVRVPRRFNACCQSARPPRGALKPITYSGHGSSGSPSARYVAGN